MSRLARLVAVGLVGLFLAGCAHVPTPPSSVETPQGPAEEGTSVEGATESGAAVVEVEVSGDEFSFSLGTLRVQTGDHVRLRFRNIGKAPHTWTIEELGIDTGSIAGGGSATVEVDAPPNAG